MRTARVRFRRSMAQHTMLVAIAGLTFMISGVAAGLSGYLGASFDVGARSTLAAAPASEAGYELSTRAGNDLTRQDAAVRETVASLLPGVPYELHRSVVTGPRSMHPAALDGTDGAEPGAIRGVLSGYADLTDHAALVAGRWPERPGRSGAHPIAVHAEAASVLGIDVGDEFTMANRGGTLVFTVTGLWAPLDDGSPYWAGERLEVGGATDHVDLLAAGIERDLAAIPGFQLRGRWRLDLDLAELTAADVAAVRVTLPQLPAAIAADPRLAGTQFDIDDSLLAALHDAGQRIQAARAIAAMPLVLLAVACVIVIGMAAHLLAVLRGPETALLRARGAAAGLLAQWAFREALPVAILPAALGVGAAWLVLAVLDLGTRVSPSVMLIGGGAAAALVVGTLTTVAYAAARAAVGPAASRRFRRLRPQVVLGVTAGVVLIPAAVAAVGWRRRGHAPLLTDADGASRIEPAAVAVPALLLLAGGLIAAIAIPAVARAGQRLAARQRGLTGPLAVRQVARRPMAYALPTVLVVVAIGTATLAAGFAATWSDLQGRAAAARTAADVQVVLGDRPARVQPYRMLPGVEHVIPAVSVPRSGPAGGDELIASGGGTEQHTGIDLPAGARSVSIELSTEARSTDDTDAVPVRAHVDLWLADEAGLVWTVGSGATRIPGAGDDDEQSAADRLVTADLPGGIGPWRVVAVDVTLSPVSSAGREPAGVVDYDVEITAIRDARSGTPARLSNPIGVRVTGDVQTPASPVTERLLPGTAADASGSGPLPVSATQAVLAANGLAVGDETTLRLPGAEVPVRVDQRIDTAAGATGERVIQADLTQLTAMLLRTSQPVINANQLWLELSPAAFTSGTAGSAIARLAGPDAVVLDRAAIEDQLRADPFAVQGQAVFWVASATLMLLAAAALVTGAAVVSRQRADEVTSLRPVGLSASQQSRSRRREQAMVAVSAAVLGAGIGWLAAALLAGLLAGTATAAPFGALPAVPRVWLGPWLVFVGTAAAAGLAVAVAHGSWVRRQALAATTPQHEVWWWGR